MQVRKKVVLVFIDALSSRYINGKICPYLSRLSQRNYAEINTVFGFLGLGGAIFAGASPNVTGIFNQYALAESYDKSPLPYWMLRLTEIIPDERVCWYSRKILSQLYGAKHLGVTVSLVPAVMMKYFHLKPEKGLSEPGSLPVQTLFDVIRENGLTFTEDSIYGDAQLSRHTDRIIRESASGELADLTVLKIDTLDVLGHRQGPEAGQVRKAAADIDFQMNRIAELTGEGEELALLVFSDHGMSPVTSYVNIERIIKSLPYKLEKDYIYFLDSTMARFWFFNKDADKAIREGLAGIEECHILTPEEAARMKIDRVDREHGDLIFAMHEGTVIYPCFFHRHKPALGMHGYISSSYDSPVMVTSGADLRPGLKKGKKIDFIDLMPTVLDLMELPTPSTCEGKSLVEK